MSRRAHSPGDAAVTNYTCVWQTTSQLFLFSDWPARLLIAAARPLSSQSTDTNCHIRTTKLRLPGYEVKSQSGCVFLPGVIINSDHTNFISISTADKSPLAQTLGSPALWNCLVTQRQLLPRANEHGVRCPLNKPPMPPSKETRGAPVFRGHRELSARTKFKIFSCYHKLSGKNDYMWKELGWPRRPGVSGWDDLS